MESPDTKSAIQIAINEQIAQAKASLGLPTTVPFSDQLAKSDLPDDPEELMNMILKQRKIPRRLRRSILANQRKPRKPQRL